MKLLVIRNNLKEGLHAVERASGENLNLPILKNALIEVDSSKIKLIATNLEIAITYFVYGKVIEEGKTTVPLSVFSTLVSNLQSERINLETKQYNLEIKNENYKATLQGLSPDDFPIIPKIKNKQEFLEIKGDVFLESLTQIISSAQPSDLRPELNSVYLSFSLENVKLVATDSFRLSEKTIPGSFLKTNHTQGFELIIPLKTIQELTRILKEDETLQIFHDPNQILFKTERFELISRLIEGNFPDYQTIIPKEFETKILFNKEECMHAVKLAGIFSSQVYETKIKVSEKKRHIEISSSDQRIGENNYILPAKIDGEAKEINFNWKYLLDGLRSVKTTDAFLGINEENKPALLRSPTDSSYLYVLMPILKA